MVERVRRGFGGMRCVWRDWRCQEGSEGRFLSGRTLRFDLVFETGCADWRAWLSDADNLSPMREWLGDTFRGATLAAADDPDLAYFRLMDRIDALRLVEVEETGVEAFAALAFRACDDWLRSLSVDGAAPPVRLVKAVAVADGDECAVAEGAA